MGLCNDLLGLLGGSTGTGGASVAAATGTPSVTLPRLLWAWFGPLSIVFLRCDPLGLADALPPQMIPLSDLLLTLRLRPVSDLELLRLLSGDNASDLKSRANALLACSNGLTGDFVARCNA